MPVFEYDDERHYILLTVNENDTVVAEHSFGDDETLVEALEDVVYAIKEANGAL